MARCRRAAAVAPAALVALVFAAGPVGAGALRVDTDGACPLVTLDGAMPSLRLVLEELSWRAGFELRSFGIEDRAVAARIEGAVLGDALRRLLGRDAYVIGVSVGAPCGSRIRWLDVPGPAAGVVPTRRSAAVAPQGPDVDADPVAHDRPAARDARAAQAAAAGASTAEAPVAEFRFPPGVFLAALDSASESEREAALRAIEAQLDVGVQREAFVRLDAKRVAEAAAPYRHAAESLASLAARAPDAGVRRKLEEVLGELYAAVERVPATHAPSRSPLAEFFE